jgi:TPR repeat protein
MCWLKRFKIKRILKNLRVMQQFRVHNQPTDLVIQKEIDIYHHLAKIYESLQGHKKYPFAREQRLACYRAAASLSDSNGQFLLGKELLAEAKLRDELQRGVVFASNSNESHMRALYEEALTFLTAAENLKHIQARRLHGLCYINGWGVPIDKNKGFDLIVESIEQENSWDRVQKVFAAIGINKAEFFSELFQHRNKK